jgi:Ca2+-transporting ATPase
MTTLWHALQRDEILPALGSRESGLTATEAADRLRGYGPNELQAARKPSKVAVFLRQFLSPLIYVLVAAAAVSIAVGHYADAGVIATVLLLNAVIGYAQETRAERAMEALMGMAAPRAKIEREGRVTQVTAREVVPGDIILLETGDRVPADARLLEEFNLRVNEAALTGESMPVDKSTTRLHEDS